jgi:low affinity Fe/Cu permease
MTSRSVPNTAATNRVILVVFLLCVLSPVGAAALVYTEMTVTTTVTHTVSVSTTTETMTVDNQTVVELTALPADTDSLILNVAQAENESATYTYASAPQAQQSDTAPLRNVTQVVDTASGVGFDVEFSESRTEPVPPVVPPLGGAVVAYVVCALGTLSVARIVLPRLLGETSE